MGAAHYLRCYVNLVKPGCDREMGLLTPDTLRETSGTPRLDLHFWKTGSKPIEDNMDRSNPINPYYTLLYTYQGHLHVTGTRESTL